jgi:nucleoside-diphosphate-sugar epimerase
MPGMWLRLAYWLRNRHGAIGEAYNITNDGRLITQREYLGTFAQELGYPPPWRRIPYGVAFAAGYALEAAFRFWRLQQPPFATRYGIWLLGREVVYSTRKAEQQLGWRPSISLRRAFGALWNGTGRKPTDVRNAAQDCSVSIPKVTEGV